MGYDGSLIAVIVVVVVVVVTVVVAVVVVVVVVVLCLKIINTYSFPITNTKKFDAKFGRE